MLITQLSGYVETHLTQLDNHTLIHKDVLQPFIELQNAAKKAGFNLQIASGFRSYQRQQRIWNNKYSGKSPLLDKHESVIDHKNITELEKLHAILHWSALPGASRHHWGTDFDIYDPTLLPEDTKLQLTCNEYQKGGYFFGLSQWLSENMAQFGFYRPYQSYQGGVAAEPWHISYQPIAQSCLQQLTITSIRDLIIENNVLGKSLICQHLPMIYKQYICNINCNGNLKMSERRRFSRVIFSGDCSLSEEVAGKIEIFETELLDISLNGALVLRPKEWHDQPEAPINLNLTLSGSDIILEISGIICHEEEGLLGIKFLTLSLESISHLKRLIELNLADEDLMHREMSQLINLSAE